MGASYWVKWSCSEPISDLRNLILPLVLAEGYDLLSWHGDWQMFDRGGIERKLAWSLSGGRWSDSPTVLTINYGRSAGETEVTFHWDLSVKPLPLTPHDRASFEEWVRGQMDRIVAGLRRQLDAARGPARASHPSVEPLTQAHQVKVTDDGVSVAQLTGANAATAVKAGHKTKVHYAGAAYEASPHCERCSDPALPVPGAAGRYYCLRCKRHLSRQPIA